MEFSIANQYLKVSRQKVINRPSLLLNRDGAQMALPKLRREDTGKKLFAIFVAIVMLGSVAGFVFSFLPVGIEEKFNYNGVELKRTQQGTLLADLDGVGVEFLYFPEDLRDITLPSQTQNLLTTHKAIYVTSDWNSSLAQATAALAFDLATALDKKHSVFVQQSFTSESPYDLPVIGCANATEFIPVINVQADIPNLSDTAMNTANNSNNGNDGSSVEKEKVEMQTGISADSNNPNCLIVSANSEIDFSRVRDRLLYAALGIGDK